jgi:SH3 domain-containing YSC84-like protein 1
MSISKSLILSLGLVLALGTAAATRAGDAPSMAKQKQDAAKRLTNATEVLRQTSPNKTALSEALCIGVVPDLTKIAVVGGGEHGEGVVTCKNANGTWSAPAFFSLSGGSVGAQAGVQRKDLVILAMTQKGKEKFFQQNFDLGAAAEATGGSRSAGKNWQGKDIAVFSTSEGAFAGIDLSGTLFHADQDEMNAVYGKSARPQTILNGKIAPPTMAAGFLKQVEQMQPTGRPAPHAG